MVKALGHGASGEGPRRAAWPLPPPEDTKTLQARGPRAGSLVSALGLRDRETETCPAAGPQNTCGICHAAHADRDHGLQPLRSRRGRGFPGSAPFRPCYTGERACPSWLQLELPSMDRGASSLETWLPVSFALFSDGLVVCWLSSFERGLRILGTSPLSGMWLVNVFFQFVACFFICLTFLEQIL